MRRREDLRMGDMGQRNQEETFSDPGYKVQ